jgi:hypothetical protein
MQKYEKDERQKLGGMLLEKGLYEIQEGEFGDTYYCPSESIVRFLRKNGWTSAGNAGSLYQFSRTVSVGYGIMPTCAEGWFQIISWMKEEYPTVEELVKAIESS